jgi:FMN reductase
MTDDQRPFIVGIGGTTRDNSGTEQALRTALSAAEALGARTRIFGGAELMRQPIYDPGDEAARETRIEFVEAVRRADGLIIASPGYHGSISGLVKNALDGLEDLRADARPYLDGRAVGAIVLSDGAQAGGSTLAALRSIIHALRGWPTPLGAVLLAGAETGADEVRLALVAEQVVMFARGQACGARR